MDNGEISGEFVSPVVARLPGTNRAQDSLCVESFDRYLGMADDFDGTRLARLLGVGFNPFVKTFDQGTTKFKLAVLLQDRETRKLVISFGFRATNDTDRFLRWC